MIRILIAAVALLGSTPVLPQTLDERALDLSRKLAKVIGLSPNGAEIWAQGSLKLGLSSAHEYDRVSAVDIAIGEELRRNVVNRERLSELVDRYAMEIAAVEKAQKKAMVDLALSLPKQDRQVLGQHIDAVNRESVAEAKPSRLPIIPSRKR